jgi:radical SAM protein with 4Fe4S-binding SPASM domain
LTTKLNRELIRAGLDRINISVIGVTSEQYHQFAGGRVDFGRYVDNIADLYHNRGNCIVFVKINGDLISEEEQWRFVEIFMPISDGCAIEHVMNCWYDTTMEGIKKNEEVGVYGDPITYVEVCPYIFYSFCVQFDGEVSACFLDWNRKIVVGNIFQKPLNKIWNDHPIQNLRVQMLMKDRQNIDICKNCDQLKAGEPINIDHIAEDLLWKIKT